MKIGMQLAVASMAVLLAAGQVQAEVLNAGFETGDLTGWTKLGSVVIETAAFGTGPSEGTYQALLSSGMTDRTDSEIETFLGLSPGALDALSTGDASEGSALKQTIMGSVGDTLSFDWNFLTSEATPSTFNDFAFWTLTNLQNGEVLADTMSTTFVASATVFDEETGFNTTSYVLPSSGSFMLGFGIMDVDDLNVNSGLLIDNVHVDQANPVPEPASLTLWGLGAVGMAFGARRRRRREQQCVAA